MEGYIIYFNAEPNYPWYHLERLVSKIVAGVGLILIALFAISRILAAPSQPSAIINNGKIIFTGLDRKLEISYNHLKNTIKKPVQQVTSEPTPTTHQNRTLKNESMGVLSVNVNGSAIRNITEKWSPAELQFLCGTILNCEINRDRNESSLSSSSSSLHSTEENMQVGMHGMFNISNFTLTSTNTGTGVLVNTPLTSWTFSPATTTKIKLLDQKKYISVFPYEYFQGELGEFELTEECLTLPQTWWYRISSVDTFGECVEICPQRNCRGPCVQVAPGTEGHDRLRTVDFDKRTKSIRACP